jgi:S1-C subfamily serine protease
MVLTAALADEPSRIGSGVANAAQANEERRAERFDAAMRLAEEALAKGEAARAAELFDQASRIAGDSGVAETGMVRAYMHSGEFRKALSYGNLATLEHKDSTFAYAFLAYLVDRGGFPERALAGLREARSRAPDDVALLGALSQILIERGDPDAALRDLEAWRARHARHTDIERLYRMALRGAGASMAAGQTSREIPFSPPPPGSAPLADVEAAWSQRWPPPYQATLPLARTAQLATASGALIDGGRRVATIGSILRDARRILIRSSRGTWRSARVETISSETGVGVLLLDEPLAEGATDQPRPARPAPGSPCYVVGYLLRDSSDQTWPVLSAGLHGTWHGPPGGAVSATIALSPGQLGAPTLDRYGSLIGIATPGPSVDGAPAANVVVRPIGNVPSSGQPPPAASASQQEIYERGFALAVLVVAISD